MILLVSRTSAYFHCFGDDIISSYVVFKFANFVEFTKGYQPAKFQCCKLLGSSFMERLQKHNDDVIMT